MQNLYIKIPDGANAVIDKLYENGHSAFVVGGCVRDFILEKEPHDWDICTDALPKQVMQIFGEKNVFQHTLSAMRNMSTSNIFPAKWVDGYVRCAL